MIGTGSSVEIRKVKGLGSIHLDISVTNNHAIGTLIRGFLKVKDMDEIMKEEDIHVTIQTQLELRISGYWHSLLPPIYLEVTVSNPQNITTVTLILRRESLFSSSSRENLSDITDFCRLYLPRTLTIAL